jgi:hypothetical protein
MVDNNNFSSILLFSMTGINALIPISVKLFVDKLTYVIVVLVSKNLAN